MSLGEYVREQREAARLTAAAAAAQAGLSRGAWEKVEADRPVRALTLRRVADALHIPPKRLLELAGLPYVESDSQIKSVSVIEDLLRRVDAMEPVVYRLAEEVRELITTVRSVHHASPGT